MRLYFKPKFIFISFDLKKTKSSWCEGGVEQLDKAMHYSNLSMLIISRSFEVQALHLSLLFLLSNRMESIFLKYCKGSSGLAGLPARLDTSLHVKFRLTRFEPDGSTRLDRSYYRVKEPCRMSHSSFKFFSLLFWVSRGALTWLPDVLICTNMFFCVCNLVHLYVHWLLLFAQLVVFRQLFHRTSLFPVRTTFLGLISTKDYIFGFEFCLKFQFSNDFKLIIALMSLNLTH